VGFNAHPTTVGHRLRGSPREWSFDEHPPDRETCGLSCPEYFDPHQPRPVADVDDPRNPKAVCSTANRFGGSLPENLSGLIDEAPDPEDWIEPFNTGDTEVDLAVCSADPVAQNSVKGSATSTNSCLGIERL